MKFRLLGTEFYVSFLFAAVITAMIAFDRTGYILPLLFAIVMHELGHLTIMWLLDCACGNNRKIHGVGQKRNCGCPMRTCGKYNFVSYLRF